MTWVMSRFRRGQWVEVRSREEILATLDDRGCLDGMPFMPEMLAYCGQRLRVGMVAHKTCEVARQTLVSRRLDATVHLEDARCDGAAHGGCEAACNLFWKDAWLKPADAVGPGAPPPPDVAPCAELEAHTVRPKPGSGGETRYACQATELFDATAPLPWWSPRQYLRDVTSGNHSLRHALSVLFHAALRRLVAVVPFGYRMAQAARTRVHGWLFGREVPDFEGAIEPGWPTPTGHLDLRPGESVRVRTKEEIARTINRKRKNRGMYFDVEMVRYCEEAGTVRSKVTKLIDEATGEMREMKSPCIILDGFVCRGEYSECRLLCPRAIYPFWREIWLERPAESEQAGE